MMNAPAVTVIIPTYNRAKYLSEAIDSVLIQDYQDFEIIIADDGSTDNTREIVAIYMNKYPDKIRYIYQENKGPGEARNSGIKEARGEYISFLDADDIFLQNSLSRKVDFLNKYSEVSLVFTDYINRKENEKLSGIEPTLKERYFLKKLENLIDYRNNDEIIFKQEFFPEAFLFSPYPICTITSLIRKKTLNDVGWFRSDINIGEDTDYWVRITENNRIGYIDYSSAVYNIYVTDSITKDKKRLHLDIAKYFLSIYDENRKGSSIIKKKVSKAYYELGYYYYDIYDMKSARKYFVKSIKYNFLQMESLIYLLCALLPVKMLNILRRYKRDIN